MTIHEKLSTIELRASAASHLAWLMSVLPSQPATAPCAGITWGHIRQARTALLDALRLLDELEREIK